MYNTNLLLPVYITIFSLCVGGGGRGMDDTFQTIGIFVKTETNIFCLGYSRYDQHIEIGVLNWALKLRQTTFKEII